MVSIQYKGGTISNYIGGTVDDGVVYIQENLEEFESFAGDILAVIDFETQECVFVNIKQTVIVERL